MGSPSAQSDPRIRGERQSQALLIGFLISGLVFMLLPGTFLGVWNLIGISSQRAVTALSPAWLQAHGQAQVFGWIGSFIIGIGFYSLTKMQSARGFPAGRGWTAWCLWTAGVALRWIGGVTAWHWRILLPVSGLFQLSAFVLFFLVVRRHRPTTGPTGMPAWIALVMLGTLGFLATLVVNAWALFRLAIKGGGPALPHLLDLGLITMAIWSVLVPTIWGFNTRWLPIFAGLRAPYPPWLFKAYGLSAVGVVFAFLDRWAISSAFLFVASLGAIRGLRIWEPAQQSAKLHNVHHTFPLFLRIAYGWLLISAGLSCVAALEDRSGGIWGASRHAITVGFVAVMVFAIGQRILPAFSGMRVLWSTGLMFWSLALLNLGCLLRVSMEPLAYELDWPIAWNLLPISAVTELTAVTLFALNLIGTLFTQPPHLRSCKDPSAK